jgi:hypothetical protein
LRVHPMKSLSSNKEIDTRLESATSYMDRVQPPVEKRGES